MESISILTAFSAGVFSFISPCVLPLIPAYISFISGISVEDLQEGGDSRGRAARVFVLTLIFVLGFSTVFVLMGAGASFVSKILFTNRVMFNRIAGTLIIVLGLHMIGVFRIGFLEYEKRFQIRENPLGALGVYLIGAAFAFGWIPCIGPILGAILALAAQKGNVGQGVLLLSSYSLGLGLPFLATGLAINAFMGFYRRIRRHLRKIEITAGVFLVLIGLLIFLDMFALLSQYLIQWFPGLIEIG